jgi:hypothetical protein
MFIKHPFIPLSDLIISERKFPKNPSEDIIAIGNVDQKAKTSGTPIPLYRALS